MGRLTRLLLFLGCSLAAPYHAYMTALPRSISPRISILKACAPRAAPPAPPRANKHTGGGGDGGLILKSMHRDERKAVVSLWSWDYDLHSSRHDDDDVKAAHDVASWSGDDEEKASWHLSWLKPRTLAAIFGDGSVEAIIVTRYELDASDWRRFLLGVHACAFPSLQPDAVTLLLYFRPAQASTC